MSGMGQQLAERAESRYGWKVEPVNVTAAMKEDMAFGMRSDFESRRLRIPADDKLRADLRSLRKQVTTSGNLRFARESPDSHCDRLWAKALRQSAVREQQQMWGMVG